MAGKPVDRTHAAQEARGELHEAQAQYRTEAAADTTSVPGLLVRAADGTLYMIPDAVLEQEPYRLPESEQPGSEQGDGYQDFLNACPPVHQVRNALRIPSGRLLEPVDAADPVSGTGNRQKTSIDALNELTSVPDPVSGTGARQKTSIPALQTLVEQTPELQQSRNWFQNIAPGDDPIGHLSKGEKGVLIRGDDGTLYFLPQEELERCRLPAEAQPEGVQAVLDECPAVYYVKNALMGSGLVSGTGARQKTEITPLQRLEEQTPAARSWRGWSRTADPRTRRGPGEPR
jgi:hypothetical protein